MKDTGSSSIGLLEGTIKDLGFNSISLPKGTTKI